MDLSDFSDKILQEIKFYALKNKSSESCGLIIKKGGALFFLPCRNISDRPKIKFKINALTFIENEVVAVYHSHVYGGSKPSLYDKKIQSALDVPFLIYSISEDDFFLYKSECN